MTIASPIHAAKEGFRCACAIMPEPPRSCLAKIRPDSAKRFEATWAVFAHKDVTRGVHPCCRHRHRQIRLVPGDDWNGDFRMNDSRYRWVIVAAGGLLG